MVLDAALLNTQQYKVRIKVPYTSVYKLLKRESPSTMVADFFSFFYKYNKDKFEWFERICLREEVDDIWQKL